jgi:hypothetical protein
MVLINGIYSKTVTRKTKKIQQENQETADRLAVQTAKPILKKKEEKDDSSSV